MKTPEALRALWALSSAKNTEKFPKCCHLVQNMWETGKRKHTPRAYALGKVGGSPSSSPPFRCLVGTRDLSTWNLRGDVGTAPIPAPGYPGRRRPHVHTSGRNGPGYEKYQRVNYSSVTQNGSGLAWGSLHPIYRRATSTPGRLLPKGKTVLRRRPHLPLAGQPPARGIWCDCSAGYSGCAASDDAQYGTPIGCRDLANEAPRRKRFFRVQVQSIPES